MMIKDIKNNIIKHRGKICWGLGLAVGGYLVYRGMNVETIRLRKTINTLSETPDKYAQDIANNMVNDILDCVYEEMYYYDKSPKGIASEAVMNVIREYANEAFIDRDAVHAEASKIMKYAVDTMVKNGDLTFRPEMFVALLEKIPEGTYGSVEVKHF